MSLSPVPRSACGPGYEANAQRGITERLGTRLNVEYSPITFKWIYRCAMNELHVHADSVSMLTYVGACDGSY